MQDVPETVQWIKKLEFWEKNGLNVKLKHRKAQKTIFSWRFGDLYGRALSQKILNIVKKSKIPGSLPYKIFFFFVIYRRNVSLQAYNSAVIRDITVTPTKGSFIVIYCVVVDTGQRALWRY